MRKKIETAAIVSGLAVLAAAIYFGTLYQENAGQVAPCIKAKADLVLWTKAADDGVVAEL